MFKVFERDFKRDCKRSNNASRVNSESNTNEEYAKGDGKLDFSSHPAQLYKVYSQDFGSSKNGSRVNSESNTNEEYAKGDEKLGFPSHPAQLYKILPPQIRRRIKALKKLQVESVHIEAEFFAEVHKLECKYNQLYSGIYQKRRDFVTGEKEPTDQDCDFTLDSSLDVAAEGANEQGFSPFGAVDANTKGIPYFWLTIFKNVDLLNDMVEPHDEPVLKHLTDIEVEFMENDPMGFLLKFVFSSNEYFSNPVLTKYYEMRCKPDEDDPFSFEGPEIIKCKGCTIDWHKNKNVTKKTIKKRQKHKTQGTVRTVSKTVKNDSFFNFFDPPQVPDDESEDVDAEIQAILTSDFEIGHYIRERIVPHAVLYFTGEALEEEEDLEEEEEEDEEELSEDSDENESVVLSKDSKNNQQEAPECKQQ